MPPQLTQTTEVQAQRITRLLRVLSRVLHRPALRLRVLALLDEIDPLALGLLRLHLLNPGQLAQLRAGGALTLAGVVGYPWADPTQDLAPLMDGTTARQLGLLDGGRWLSPAHTALTPEEASEQARGYRLEAVAAMDGMPPLPTLRRWVQQGKLPRRQIRPASRVIYYLLPEDLPQVAALVRRPTLTVTPSTLGAPTRHGPSPA